MIALFDFNNMIEQNHTKLTRLNNSNNYIYITDNE